MVSETLRRNQSNPRGWVLILVLMEDGFGEGSGELYDKENREVLILVLMEDGFGEKWKKKKRSPSTGLNPCFNGRWFRSGNGKK